MASSNHRPDILKPSTPDTIALGMAVEERFIRLCNDYLRVKKERLVPPKFLDSAMLLWRTMRVRHMSGDPRNTLSELKAVQAIAQWTLDCKCQLCNQPREVLEWPS
jgi:hypothetical protein